MKILFQTENELRVRTPLSPILMGLVVGTLLIYDAYFILHSPGRFSSHYFQIGLAAFLIFAGVLMIATMCGVDMCVIDRRNRSVHLRLYKLIGGGLRSVPLDEIERVELTRLGSARPRYQISFIARGAERIPLSGYLPVRGDYERVFREIERYIRPGEKMVPETSPAFKEKDNAGVLLKKTARTWTQFSIYTMVYAVIGLYAFMHGKSLSSGQFSPLVKNLFLVITSAEIAAIPFFRATLLKRPIPEGLDREAALFESWRRYHLVTIISAGLACAVGINGLVFLELSGDLWLFGTFMALSAACFFAARPMRKGFDKPGGLYHERP